STVCGRSSRRSRRARFSAASCGLRRTQDTHCACTGTTEKARSEMAEIPNADLLAAYYWLWYTISGCGGDLSEWTAGYEEWLTGIGKPVAWYQTTGAEINEFAGETHGPFPEDVVVLMFPLDGMPVGKLAMFKIEKQDRWFDDVIDNMRVD